MMKTIDSLLDDLKKVLKNYKKKPYLPVWGEIFSILKSVKRIAERSKNDVFFYQLSPIGRIKYDYDKKQFIAEIPDVNIKLNLGELADSLMNDRFLPMK